MKDRPRHRKTITITLPPWVDEKTSIHIIAGSEVVAKVLSPIHPWTVKSVRCARCGMCCLYENYGLYCREPDDDGNGRCRHVEIEEVVDGIPKYMCAHPDQPWSCVKGSGEEMVAERYIDGKHPLPEGLVVGSCMIRFEELEMEED